MSRDELTHRLGDLLRDISAGRVTVGYVGQSWRNVYAGNVTFMCSDGTKIVLFNDCDELDYTDSATFVDGARWDYGADDPLRDVNSAGSDHLQALFTNAPEWKR
jgi:hypothetical protein